jgi:hypothetical protein
MTISSLYSGKDFTMTHTRFGRSNLHPIGQLTDIRRSDGPPEPDGTLKSIYDDFSRLQFF